MENYFHRNPDIWVYSYYVVSLFLFHIPWVQPSRQNLRCDGPDLSLRFFYGDALSTWDVESWRSGTQRNPMGLGDERFFYCIRRVSGVIDFDVGWISNSSFFRFGNLFSRVFLIRIDQTCESNSDLIVKLVHTAQIMLAEQGIKTPHTVQPDR